jgi:hypothetical protein
MPQLGDEVGAKDALLDKASAQGGRSGTLANMLSKPS